MKSTFGKIPRSLNVRIIRVPKEEGDNKAENLFEKKTKIGLRAPGRVPGMS